MPSFSIVVPARQSARELERLLPALRALEPPQGGVEVIVEDAASTAQSRELGWRRASGSVVVFLQAATTVAADWLLELERALVDTGADVIVGERQWDGDAPELAVRRALARALDGHVANALVGFSLLGGNVAIRRDALARTSGFNPCLRWFEEVELGLRLLESGARFARAPRAIARCGWDGADKAWFDDDEMQALFWRFPYLPVIELHQRITGRPVAFELPSCQSSEHDLVAHYSRVDGVPEPALREWLALGLARGLYHQRQGDTVSYPAERMTDWLRDSTPYLQAIYLKEQGEALFRPDPVFDPARVVRCRGRFRLSFDAGAARAAGIDKVNIPVPEANERQRELHFERAQSVAMLEATRRAGGMLVGFPIPEGDGEVELSYDFTFEADQTMSAKRTSEDPDKHLRVGLPADYRERAEAVVRDLRGDSAFDTARAIYEWNRDRTLFGSLPPQMPYYRILDFGSGVCIQQVRLMVSLCRVAGIPAREVCGALLPAGGEEHAVATKQMRTRGHGPFAHTWAEFYCADRGWLPLEVHSFGKRGFLPSTVPDERLRDEIRRVLYERYPFGSLHPYRVSVGPQANRLATFLPSKHTERGSLERLIDSTYHQLECTFERV